jgi:hypothetical protein
LPHTVGYDHDGPVVVEHAPLTLHPDRLLPAEPAAGALLAIVVCAIATEAAYTRDATSSPSWWACRSSGSSARSASGASHRGAGGDGDGGRRHPRRLLPDRRAHMIGRAVYRAGRVRRDLLVVDELAGSNANDEAST